jgi:hypothetical protein
MSWPRKLARRLPRLAVYERWLAELERELQGRDLKQYCRITLKGFAEQRVLYATSTG